VGIRESVLHRNVDDPPEVVLESEQTGTELLEQQQPPRCRPRCEAMPSEDFAGIDASP
jgi:hypothetical protein